MNDQNKQQEMQLLEEACLDQVTGGGGKPSSMRSSGTNVETPPSLPWNHPFDSGNAPTTGSAESVIDPFTHKAHLGAALDEYNYRAVFHPENAETISMVHVNHRGMVTTIAKAQ